MASPLPSQEMECGLDSDESLLVPATRSSWGWKKVAGAAASVALVLAGAATVGRSAFASHPSGAASVQDSVGFQAMMSYTPPREQCSKATEDCMATGCCAMSGAKCYKVAGKGKCMKKCPGCETVAPHEVTVAKFPGLSFFCFESYTNNTGSTKKSYELELIKMQKEKGVSIIRCSEQASEDEVLNAPCLFTIQVEDVKGDWHFAKRQLMGAWINTGMFFPSGRKLLLWAHASETKLLLLRYSPTSSMSIFVMYLSPPKVATTSSWMTASSATRGPFHHGLPDLRRQHGQLLLCLPGKVGVRNGKIGHKGRISLHKSAWTSTVPRRWMVSCSLVTASSKLSGPCLRRTGQHDGTASIRDSHDLSWRQADFQSCRAGGVWA